MITIKIQPQTITPAYNEVILVLDSDNKAKPLFQFIIDTNIYGTAQSRVKLSSNPQGYAVFDMHKHLEPFVSSNIDHDGTTVFTQVQSAYTKYDVTLFEQYRIDVESASGTDSGGFVLWTDATEHNLVIGDKISVTSSTVAAYNGIAIVTSVPSTTSIVTDKVYISDATADYVIFDNSATIIPSATVMSGDSYAFNGVLPWVDVPNWDYTNYDLQNNTDEMLTSAHQNYVVKDGDRIWFNIYNPGSPSTATIDFLRVFTYNISGTLIGNYRVSNGFSGNTDGTRFLNVGVGPWNLNNSTDTIFPDVGTLPVIGSAVTSYEVHAYNTSNGRISKSYTFDVDGDCSEFENFRMIYLDKLGSFLNINFSLAHKVNRRNRRKTYQQNYGAYNPATNTWGYNSWDRGITHLDAELTKTININTDYVNENVGNMVADLVESSEVYHLDESGILRAVMITTSNVEILQRKTDKLIKYKVSFEYANKNTVQRG